MDKSEVNQLSISPILGMDSREVIVYLETGCMIHDGRPMSQSSLPQEHARVIQEENRPGRVMMVHAFGCLQNSTTQRLSGAASDYETSIAYELIHPSETRKMHASITKILACDFNYLQACLLYLIISSGHLITKSDVQHLCVHPASIWTFRKRA